MMAEFAGDTCVTSVADAPAVGLTSAWSSGCFWAAGCHPPEACLNRCLTGESSRAATHGCELVRRLARQERAGADCADGDNGHLPKSVICDQGYQVSCFGPQEPGEPSILVLSPPPSCQAHWEAMAPGIEALRLATREKWRLNQENEGLADEVLQCYQQVNLIFDISAEVAVLTEAHAVRNVLLEKIRDVYGADGVFYINEESNLVAHVDKSGSVAEGRLTDVCPELGSSSRSSPGDGPVDARGCRAIVLTPQVESAIRELKSAPRLFFSSEGDARFEQRGHGTSIWGPLREGGSRAAVVGVVRWSKALEAGDMLLLDSTLTFGSHILSSKRLGEQLQQASFEAVRALVNAMDQKDPYTSGHSERVGFLAEAIGKAMGLTERQLQELEWGGLLHDIGKIGIPESVLNKPGVLSEEEFAVIKNHPARGFAVLRPVESLQGVLEIVLHHHETPDGQGYPDGLTREKIPLLAGIVHVADTFDALTSTRSYRTAFDEEVAISILRRDAGPKLDPAIVEIFLEVWSRLPDEHPEEYQRWFGAREVERV